MKTYAIDIDGVLADFVGAFTKLTKDRLGKTIPEIATSWNWHLDHGVSPAESAELWQWIEDHPGWWRSLKILPGAADFLGCMNNTELVPYFITTRPQSAFLDTKIWLQACGVMLPSVVHVKYKGGVMNHLMVNAMLDDRPEYCEDAFESSVSNWMLTNNPLEISLLTQPWNADWKPSGRLALRMKRVGSLEEWLRLEGLIKP